MLSQSVRLGSVFPDDEGLVEFCRTRLALAPVQDFAANFMRRQGAYVTRVEAAHRRILEHFNQILADAKNADNAYVTSLVKEVLVEFVDGNGEAQSFLKRLQLTSCERAQKIVSVVRLQKYAIALSRRLACERLRLVQAKLENFRLVMRKVEVKYQIKALLAPTQQLYGIRRELNGLTLDYPRQMCSRVLELRRRVNSLAQRAEALRSRKEEYCGKL